MGPIFFTCRESHFQHRFHYSNYRGVMKTTKDIRTKLKALPTHFTTLISQTNKIHSHSNMFQREWNVRTLCVTRCTHVAVLPIVLFATTVLPLPFPPSFLCSPSSFLLYLPETGTSGSQPRPFLTARELCFPSLHPFLLALI